MSELLSWAAARAADGDIPDHVLRTALVIMCDDLAAMVVAHTEDEVRAVTAQAGGGPSESTLVGAPGRRTDRRSAALANAVAANWTELDGGYRPATCHGSLYSLPAALAEVEATGGTLGDLLRAHVLGYEVVTRVARAYRPPLPLVLHPHATLSPIGAAAALAAARRLGPDAFATTVFGAASMSLTGPFSHATSGATIRNAWAGAGAQLGFVAADVAAAGLTASPTVLDEVFAGTVVTPDELTAGLGERWAVEDGYQKPYACCQYLHASVEAASLLAGSVPADGEITAVDVRTHPLGAALTNASPATTLAGRFSLPHAVATVLHHRTTAAAVFSGATLHEPAVAALRGRVRIEEWADPPAPPHDRPSTVRVTLGDGRVLEETVLSAAGGPDRPLSRPELLTKYERLTGELQPGFAGRVRTLTDPRGPLDLDAPLRGVLAALLGTGGSR
ncbi:MmgE/PrpD family protein [Pseudonocardia sp. N23]|uniref:MmgE/PrpD family protein n=1 Tax=Pseudonocardia sp. N23 TaxID=1987376 RepID=UPI000BFDD87A|nr:MmgE/PrpD family protein [Pseudonocardia sp. N23]GAY09795.1 MmgE/PrpD family protein [Pseudonocardia sp. N23]